MADPTPILALQLVFEAVRDRFATEAPNTKVVFGWRTPPNQLDQGVGRANRIAFVPGVEGKMGGYLGARAPGRYPRPLRTLLEQATVYCWAYDGNSAANAQNELAQYVAARNLHDAAIRAIELALRSKAIANLPTDKGRQPYSDPEWLLPDAEKRFGAECRFVLTLEAEITDCLPNLAGVGGSLIDTATTRQETSSTVVTLGAEIAQSGPDPNPETDAP